MTSPNILQRPILGGVFGSGRYVLATTPCIENGLHAVRFMVLDPRGGRVLAVADTKLAALAAARVVLRAAERVEEERTALNAQGTLWPAEAFDGPPVRMRPTPISKRRREVFAKSEGRCHYCGEELTLDGRWHVEHMMPRALGGADELGNLVAACVRCNLEKSDRTAVEFVLSSCRR
ncbi:HNH endonuclease [Rubrivivax gelatinosus]|uniref:HNH endonuclease n=1 Tax=Rubrivivax gelatinosus TaxID=28068 RepID=UPI0009DA554D|nr:HNH endonuclease signature motif containing protein [Rubrivivax gelatinosus]MBG6082719.1 5-methylcytosine-specific restriction endonuclease McrA [Rubrivivax gelatinosus]